VGRRTVFLLAATALAVLLSSGVALALNTINCKERAQRCVGTDRPDLMRGTGGDDLMFGRDKGDTLKGFGRFDALLGQKGDDRLFGGTRQDFLIGGLDDDQLRGEDALDLYFFERSDWGQDTIIEESPSRNVVFLPFRRSFTGPITTNMTSGPAPEVSNAESGSTVNWDGAVIRIVVGSSGDDTVTGTDGPDDIFDDAGPDTDTGDDTDTILGGSGGDLLVVQDGDGDDTVTCGPGNDTVFFDEGDTLLDEPSCEEQNPPLPDGPGERQATPYGDQVLEDAPDAVLEGYRP
jgi:Ca2+-binding RTX toxin-like protein